MSPVTDDPELFDTLTGHQEERARGAAMARDSVARVCEHWRAFYESNPTADAREALVKALSLKERLDAIVDVLHTSVNNSHRTGEAFGEIKLS